MHLSNEEHIIHLESGYEKQMSVILLFAACLNSLTLLRLDLPLMIVRVKSLDE
jgi:hypothetical protein